jgi:hypothetical protein
VQRPSEAVLVQAQAYGIPIQTLGLFDEILFVDKSGRDRFSAGRRPWSPLATVQAAVNKAGSNYLIAVAPGEYDEDVVVTKSKLTIMGLGPKHSVRITGVAAGTKTALTLTNTQDVGLINLNLEGRTTGGGLAVAGQTRRLHVAHSKIHGGANALKLSNAGGQAVDICIEDNVIGLATNGLSIVGGGGDPLNQLIVRRNLFQRIDTDCLVTDGVAYDVSVLDNIFAAKAGVEPTRYIKLDAAGTTGIVAGNQFATAANLAAKIVLAAGVMFGPNGTEAGWSTTRPA